MLSSTLRWFDDIISVRYSSLVYSIFHYGRDQRPTLLINKACNRSEWQCILGTPSLEHKPQPVALLDWIVRHSDRSLRVKYLICSHFPVSEKNQMLIPSHVSQPVTRSPGGHCLLISKSFNLGPISFIPQHLLWKYRFFFFFFTSGTLKMANDQNPAFISFQKPVSDVKMLFFTEKYPG